MRHDSGNDSANFGTAGGKSEQLKLRKDDSKKNLSSFSLNACLTSRAFGSCTECAILCAKGCSDQAKGSPNPKSTTQSLKHEI